MKMNVLRIKKGWPDGNELWLGECRVINTTGWGRQRGVGVIVGEASEMREQSYISI